MSLSAPGSAGASPYRLGGSLGLPTVGYPEVS